VFDAAKKASPSLLEPLMALEVVVPEDYLGSVMGDVTSRRGSVKGMNARGNVQVLNAEVPLSEMFGYATDLRSMTQGRAVFTMQFSHYGQAPNYIIEQLMEKFYGKAAI
jgi:elongation factor G